MSDPPAILADPADDTRPVALPSLTVAIPVSEFEFESAPPPSPLQTSALGRLVEMAPAAELCESGTPYTKRFSGTLHHEVWRLAWPSVLTMLLQTFNSLMDALFVGHLAEGKAALAATGVGGSVIFLLVSLGMGVSVGTTALVARFTGAEQHEDAVHATGQSLTLAFILAIVFGLAAYAARGSIVALMLDDKKSPEAAALCIRFLSAALLATVPLFVMNVLMGSFRGLGDTRTPMLVTLVVIAVHISFNFMLIYGRMGFPHLGVRGAGTAFALSIWVGAVLYVIALVRRSPLAGALKREHLALSVSWTIRILRVGLPAAVQAVIRTLGMMSFTGMLARTAEGAAAVAALQIGVRAEALAFMPGFGYSVAASALVGQSLGARDPVRAERSAMAATAQALVVMSLMAAIFFCCARQFAGLFTPDILVRQLGTDYLRVNAICEPFLALGMVLTGALQGAGDTVRPTFITLFTMWVIRLPLASLLMFTLHLEAHGAWLAMSLTTILGGIMTLILFRAGTWKRIKV